jgi:glycosyltransferase involved in cell wall biosynthesis
MSAGGDRHRDPQTLFSALAVVKEQMPEAEIVVQSRSPLPAPPGIAKIRALSHTGLRDLYARASVVVVATSSNLHVSGMTVGMEAMATGRPVAMTGTPGMEDYISDGVTGRLTPPGDPAALAASVLALLRDPVTARRMGLAARREIEGSMTTTHLAGRLSRFLRS